MPPVTNTFYAVEAHAAPPSVPDEEEPSVETEWPSSELAMLPAAALRGVPDKEPAPEESPPDDMPALLPVVAPPAFPAVEVLLFPIDEPPLLPVEMPPLLLVLVAPLP